MFIVIAIIGGVVLYKYVTTQGATAASSSGGGASPDDTPVMVPSSQMNALPELVNYAGPPSSLQANAPRGWGFGIAPNASEGTASDIGALSSSTGTGAGASGTSPKIAATHRPQSSLYGHPSVSASPSGRPVIARPNVPGSVAVAVNKQAVGKIAVGGRAVSASVSKGRGAGPRQSHPRPSVITNQGRVANASKAVAASRAPSARPSGFFQPGRTTPHPTIRPVTPAGSRPVTPAGSRPVATGPVTVKRPSSAGRPAQARVQAAAQKIQGRK